MRKSRLSKKIQDKLMKHFVASTTARCASELVELNRNAAAYYYKRLREIIAYQRPLHNLKIKVGEAHFYRLVKEAIFVR